MKKLLTFILLFVSFFVYSQNSGINFQGVGRNSSGVVLASTKISLRFSVIQGSEIGAVEYVESKEVTTNAQGIFSVVIGDGTQISKTGNFTDINWKINPKFLKVEMDAAGGSNFVAMGTTRLQAVPFAYYANGVNADNVDGVLSASKGGTGVASISALKTALAIDQINNTSDLAKPISTATQAVLDTKVEKVDGMQLSTNDFTTLEKTKLAAISGTNTGDQDLSELATISQLNSKANASDLALKAPIDSPTFTGTVSGITKAMVGLGSVDNTTDLAKPISSATRLALNDKADKDSTVFTKDILINGVRVGRGPNNLDNTVLGKLSFTRNTTGYSNTAVGLGALLNNTTETFNTAIGTFSLNSDSLKVGNNNVAIGFQTLRYNEAGNNNVAVGNYALNSNGVGSNNTALGFSADVTNPNLTVTNSTAIGSRARVSTSNTIQLGDADVTRINTSGTLYAGAIQNTPIGTISPTIGVFTDLTVNGTVSGITKATIGLSNVDNSSDLAKPISTLTQAALDTKVSTATFSTTVATKENATNKSTATDLGGLNPSDVLFPTQKAVKDYITANAASGNIADGGITTIKLADGAVTNDKIATGINKSKVGLNNVENTADLDKPISTATQIALDAKVSSSTYSTSIALKAPIESPTFSGTVSGITKAMVGLGSVDNTSDLGKPVSTLTQAALDNKASKDSTSFSKDILINEVRVGRGPNNLDNTVLGKLSLNRNTTGNGNTAIGYNALINNTTQEFNTAVGNYALNSDPLKVGSHNVGIGLQTLRYNEAGNNNVAVGNFALYSNGVGSNNTALGFSADVSNPSLTVSNSTAIGSNALVSTSNTIQLGDANVTRINTSGTLYAGAIQNTPIGTISPTTGKFTDLTVTGNTVGLTKSMVGLSLVDNTSDLSKPISTLMQTALDTKVSSSTLSNSLSTKENSTNKSTDTDLGGSNPSDDLYPSQRAVKAYIAANNASGGVSDGSITTVKLADGAVTGAKLAASIAGYKIFKDGAGKVITSTNATPDLILPTGSVPTGGSSVWQSFVPTASGKLSIVEFETGNPTNLNGMPPIAYVEIYAGEGISGTLLGRSNDFTISMFGRTWKSFEFNGSIIDLYTGNTYTARLITSTSNQDWVYGDNNLYNSGITNVSSSWDHNFKTSLKVFTNDQFLTSSSAQNLFGSLETNATHTGDVTGATSLTITDGVVSTAKISDGAVTTAKLANSVVDLTSKVTGYLPTSNIADGAITTAKLANTSVDLSTKVTGLLPTANIADGAITSSKISNGEVGLTNKVSGILPTSNGGTGTATSTANLIFATPNGISGAPIFRSLVSADLPTNLSGYIQNAPSSAQSASININGSIIAGGLQNTPIGNATSSSGAFTTLTTSGTASVGGTLTVTGVATFSETPILSTTSASKALFTNSNKGIVSNNITGTGNVVMSANPTLTGNVTLETITSSKDLSVNGINIGVGKGNFNTNTAIGSNPMFSNTTGEGNIAIGYQNLFLNTTGANNIALGYRSLTKNVGANDNIGIGFQSLFENISGNSNVAIGYQSLFKNTSGSQNIGRGYYSLNKKTEGQNNE
jgi:hypothetical protein